jgi:hypothetical protein
VKVLFLPEIREYFRELAEILYKKEYFGFEESAIRCTEDLFSDIENSLPTKLKKPASKHFDKYGKNLFYAVFKKNNDTQWYVFFNTYEMNGDTIYLGRYLGNNHNIAQYIER